MRAAMTPRATTSVAGEQSAATKTDLVTNANEIELLGEIIPEVYEHLRNLAEDYLRGERANHTLQATALVHEAYLRLRDQRKVDWRNRAQFLGIAAQMMRRVLKNYATARGAAKRGGHDQVRLTLDEALEFYHRSDISVAAVDEALSELEKLDARQGQIVELRFFGGLTIEEIAKVLKISPATVKREWATAKLWLQHQLSEMQT
jgi:RNA polymerase sigma-70 factor (ECF subfamily)